jgi:hypothetical protein
MRTGRPKTTLTMSNDERAHLLAITRSRSLPAALTLRAKIVLPCEREPSNADEVVACSGREAKPRPPSGFFSIQVSLRANDHGTCQRF